MTISIKSFSVPFSVEKVPFGVKVESRLGLHFLPNVFLRSLKFYLVLFIHKNQGV